MSILNEFYLGNINPSQKFIKNGSKYHKLNKQFNDDIDALERLMDKKQKELFTQIQNTQIELDAVSEEESYIEGFCTGAKIMLEIINHKNKNYV